MPTVNLLYRGFALSEYVLVRIVSRSVVYVDCCWTTEFYRYRHLASTTSNECQDQSRVVYVNPVSVTTLSVGSCTSPVLKCR